MRWHRGCCAAGVVLRSCISRGRVQMRWFARPGGGCTSSVRLHTGACNFQRKRPSRGCGPYKLLCKYARAWLRARKRCPVIQAAALYLRRLQHATPNTTFPHVVFLPRLQFQCISLNRVRRIESTFALSRRVEGTEVTGAQNQ